MLRIRTAAPLAMGAASLALLGSAPGAVAARAQASGASAAVSPAVVAPGGSFTLTVDCSALTNPVVTTGSGMGLEAPVTLTSIGGGRYQGTGRLGRNLGNASAVGIDGNCGSTASTWTAGIIISAFATSPPTPTPTPTVTRTPTLRPTRTPTVRPTSTPTVGPTRTPAVRPPLTPDPSRSATAGAVRGGLGGAFGGHPTVADVAVGSGLVAAGVATVYFVLRRRTRAQRH
ncbi:hypothetical protein ACIQNU_10295 [Streptomyces sp. NPDC091292]|uniref:hypothetical protein n=1 Tax=Streptomyces sp. NPDC091292 TaxID=3365991 RepID=UPI003810580E